MSGIRRIKIVFVLAYDKEVFGHIFIDDSIFPPSSLNNKTGVSRVVRANVAPGQLIGLGN